MRPVCGGGGVAFGLGASTANTGEGLRPDFLRVCRAGPLAPVTDAGQAIWRLNPAGPAKAINLAVGALAAFELQPGPAGGAAGHFFAGLEAGPSAALPFCRGEDHLFSVTGLFASGKGQHAEAGPDGDGFGVVPAGGFSGAGSGSAPVAVAGCEPSGAVTGAAAQ